MINLVRASAHLGPISAATAGTFIDKRIDEHNLIAPLPNTELESNKAAAQNPGYVSIEIYDLAL